MIENRNFKSSSTHPPPIIQWLFVFFLLLQSNSWFLWKHFSAFYFSLVFFLFYGQAKQFATLLFIALGKWNQLLQLNMENIYSTLFNWKLALSFLFLSDAFTMKDCIYCFLQIVKVIEWLFSNVQLSKLVFHERTFCFIFSHSRQKQVWPTVIAPDNQMKVFYFLTRF